MSRFDDVLMLVGKLNYAWTNTESLFIYLIAHLLDTNKEAATIVFLTLNTTRARIDLLERLAKIRSTPPDVKKSVLDITSRMTREQRLRNKYNHCIYSFDESGRMASTQLMRIIDMDESLKYGKVEALDDAELQRIQNTIDSIISVNRSIWSFMQEKNISH
ncbi:hypothetical protein M8997_019005 [Phyllobacterium sp. 21LDTY02-6]|jgi:hypothetical protein|uniref:hypothetical protein n=1 Tax=unclassified Phyllobacterium TaxID=2638441 RepID=UPI002020F2F3|nr:MULTISPECIES: hypothetical protein [unclassified Phyllobacterium]MCO4319280.1 hypothetical protein [Phyllobacterium sp. 21LDTY02-6]MCX8279957.1 hypothetical protein [Phyllobacterium sp. 0TCS1.6C]MCX8296124.1 hypothetical protein [Phyllobacterium sp. 0TCS1.6A]